MISFVPRTIYITYALVKIMSPTLCNIYSLLTTGRPDVKPKNYYQEPRSKQNRLYYFIDFKQLMSLVPREEFSLGVGIYLSGICVSLVWDRIKNNVKGRRSRDRQVNMLLSWAVDFNLVLANPFITLKELSSWSICSLVSHPHYTIFLDIELAEK